METGTADIRSRGGAVTESSERHSLDNIEGNNKSANTTKRGEVLASGNEQGVNGKEPTQNGNLRKDQCCARDKCAFKSLLLQDTVHKCRHCQHRMHAPCGVRVKISGGPVLICESNVTFPLSLLNPDGHGDDQGDVGGYSEICRGCIEELMAGQKAYVLSETANFMQDTASVNNDEWERNGGEELGKILGWTAVDLAKYNSLTTKVNEDDRRDFLKSFEKDVMRVDDDQLNQFKDGVYMMHMKRKAVERLDANAVSSKGGMCEH